MKKAHTDTNPMGMYCGTAIICPLPSLPWDNKHSYYVYA